MAGFSVSWLDLREPADHRARASSLAGEAMNWVRNHSAATRVIVDLGAGTGSSLRALSADNNENILWRLVDQDKHLLDEAHQRHCVDLNLDIHELDLTALNMLPLADALLVTASALFDLVSREFVDALVAMLASQKHTAIYIALNYDGTTEWAPAHPLDAAVLAAFNRDQRRDKSFGEALGPDATAYLKQVLTDAGYRVSLAESPWQLDQKDHQLVSELIKGIAAAVSQGHGLSAADVDEWQAFRLQHAPRGWCKVGHQDLLAIPIQVPAAGGEGVSVYKRFP